MEKPIKIFYVDDDADDIETFEDALFESEKPIDLISFNNSLVFLDHLNNSKVLPDYILLDINMPKESGKEILINLKQNKRYRGISIIMYSTTTSEDEIRECYKAGAAGFIRKGFSLEDIQRDFFVELERLSEKIC